MRKITLLSVTYEFSSSDHTADKLTRGFSYVGQNDVGYPLYVNSSGKLYLLDSHTNQLLYLAPSVDAFFSLVDKFNGLDVKTSQQSYALAVRQAINTYGPELLNGGFWSVLIEEIENGIL